MNNHNEQGVTLVELMVSMVIASVIFIGVIQVTIASKSNFHFQDQISSMQENARFALHQISKGIKNSHYLPSNCTEYTAVANLTWSNQTNKRSVIGSGLAVEVIHIDKNEPKVYSKLQNAMDQSDALYLGSIHSQQYFEVASYNKEFMQFQLTAEYEQVKQDVFLMTDDLCQQMTTFYGVGEHSKVQNDVGIMDVINVSGVSSENIKNCVNHYFGHFYCLKSDGAQLEGEKTMSGFFNNIKVFPVTQMYFYVANSTQKDGLGNHYPALFLNQDELVQGVETLNIKIGMDTDDDGILNQYIESTQIQDSDWVHAKSLKIEMTIRSLEKIQSQKSTNDDGYLRQSYSQVIGLRNE